MFCQVTGRVSSDLKRRLGFLISRNKDKWENESQFVGAAVHKMIREVEDGKI